MKQNSPKIVEVVTSSVSERTKWNRSKGKKLSKKVYVARLIFLDETNKRREKTKEFDKRKDAEDYNRELLAKVNRSGGREIEAEKMTFNDLSSFYEKHYAKKAEYVGERKVAGLRSVASVQTHLKTLCAHFGKQKINKMTYGHLRDFQILRLNAPVEKEVKVRSETKDETGKTKIKWEKETRFSQRTIASVNRELSLLRRMLNIAESEGWIAKNPFKSGASLINTADETHRIRVLTVEEEKRLLDVCNCDERQHLKAIIICAIDTGMRFSEMRTLTWQGVDFDAGLIHVKAFNTKTAKPKTVPITPRLHNELIRLRDEQLLIKGQTANIVDDLVFGVKSNVKRSWTTARKLAGIEGVKFHDLRHTTGTRLNQKGLSPASIGRILGHQQITTTYRYINPDNDLLEEAKKALGSFHNLENIQENLEAVDK